MDVRSAYTLSHLSHQRKVRNQPEPPSSHKVLRSQTEDFQKLLADASFKTTALNEAEKKGKVIPQLAKGVTSPRILHPTHPISPRPWAEQFRIYNGCSPHPKEITY